MGKLKSDESINDHMKESIDMLNAMVDSIGVGHYHNTTTLNKITPDSVRFVIEHVRDTIQMLDELCDELEDDKDEIRREYEEKVIQFFNRFMSSDLSDEYDFRMKEVVRNIHEIENHYMKEIQELTKELEEERERSNRLEKRCGELIRDRDNVVDLAKKFVNQNGCDITSCYPKHLINNPASFCGNCKYFSMRPNDVGFCNNKHADPFIVDPDDTSCQAFESNNPTVVIDKPEFPCCEHCSHEDCDDCNLCPF